MTRVLFAFVLILFALCAPPAVEADPGQPPPPEPALAAQPNPDIYTCCGIGEIDSLNTVERQMLETGVVRWRYRTQPGCEGLDVGLKEIIVESHALWTAEVGVVFVEDDVNGWEQIGNCGSQWKALCPGAVGCLAHSWPYNGRIDYDAPTLLSYAFRESKVAVVTHEVCHQIATCNEQYAIASFSCIPGWRDFMNCGPDSRHGFERTEKERMKRILYPVPLTQTGYDFNGAWFVWACGFDRHATRLSILVDRHDGRGIVWAGVYPKITRDRNGCMGVGEIEGLRIELGADYYAKQENVLSAFRWYNEACVRGSLACR